MFILYFVYQNKEEYCLAISKITTTIELPEFTNL